MITVYIWMPGNGPGHASMKIVRSIHTRYYSWWPAGAAQRDGAAGSAEAKPAATEADTNRGNQGKDRDAGGEYDHGGSNMDDEEPDFEFYFRPSSGLNAGVAEQVWAWRPNALARQKAAHDQPNCSITVIESLAAAMNSLPASCNGVKRPTAPGGVVSPASVYDFCNDLAIFLNNHRALWKDGLPPVVARQKKGEAVDRFFNPVDKTIVRFSEAARREVHAD